MPDKEREVETEVDDIDDLLFGTGEEDSKKEDPSDSILTPEVNEVIKKKPKKVFKKTTKKTTKKKTMKAKPKPKPKAKPKTKPVVKLEAPCDQFQKSQESEPEPELKPELPKDEFVDAFYGENKPKPHIDGGPNATETHEPSGHKRRNRKFVKKLPMLRKF